jgi:very-short-patch-repair endonuclease
MSSPTQNNIDTRIAALAAKYDGLVPVAPLLTSGHSYRSLKARVDHGLLTWVCRGVLRLASTPPTAPRRAVAIALVVPGTWISHTTALDLHGIAISKPRSRSRTIGDHAGPWLDDPALHPAHVSNPNRIRLGVAISHMCTMPARSDLLLRNGVLISRPWLALVEAATVVDDRTLAVLLDAAVQQGLVAPARIADALERHGRTRGSRSLAQLLDERLNGAGLLRSFFEHDLDRLVRRAGFNGAIRNYSVTLPGGTRRVLDLAWPNYRIALEADSWQHHSSTGDWGRTRIRDRELTAAGWIILPVVVADIRNPEALLHDLTDTIALRRAS